MSGCSTNESDWQIHIAVHSQSKAAVEEAVNAVLWINQTVGSQPITHDPFIKTVIASLQRLLAKPWKKKEPIMPAMLKDLVDAAGSSPSLSEARTVAIALVAFSAFLRVDEVISLRCWNVQFYPSYMVIKILSSKTDQLHQGDECFKLAAINSNSTEQLFRAIVHSRNGEKLRKLGSLSYPRIRELLQAKLQSLGYDPSLFGTRSFRAGGAMLAADQGVQDRILKRHERWRSEMAKDGYVKDFVETRLKISRKLGL
ncbi:PREDICTED: uncharacterized protein LOC100634483 [Amphimedon queenslandica]|uniref:Tyr recombinase domain-containing protein n=1 Tax=Amphimedon queenslandica TaxID=400682 RepID=A0AAN0IMH0_AMPQE|nr:PREDICTED: uncharacterized protein LOC100634483 [Amphimedon queenslandica]|eukprot:XP_011404397.1 PREDICTED: uncharacterized protein LOC100634483 [Amphimedon queenslandica]